jgi:hypothetical protein
MSALCQKPTGNSAPVGVIGQSLLAQIDARAFGEIGLDATANSTLRIERNGIAARVISTPMELPAKGRPEEERTTD